MSGVTVMRIGFIGNFDVSFSTESDRAWSFEKLGHEVIKFQENRTNLKDISKYLEVGDNKIGVLFYSHTHGWEIKNLVQIFQLCKIIGIPTVSVHLDRWAWLARESDIGNEATWFTEYLFMADGSPEAVKLYKKYNLNWNYLAPGVVERDCYLAQPDRIRFPHDIIFVGSRGYHPEYQFRPQLIDWLKNKYGDRFGHYGGDGISGTIRGHELNTLYASAKIVVGDSCFGGRPYYVSDRYYETRGRGGFLMHPYQDGIDQIGVVSYKNLVELEDMIEFYLKNDDIREKLRLDGFNHVKQSETYTQRAQQMLDIIFSNAN